jgi:predicted dehydrogenase
MITIGIIGTGRICWQHVEGFLACREARITALANRSPQKARDLAAKYGLDPVKTQVFDDYRRLLPRVDAVAIVTPDDTHAAIVRDALAAGKHVLCEKPLALNGAEAEALARLARDAGVAHMVRFHLRFSRAAEWLRRAVANGDLGEVRHLRARLTVDRLGDPAAPFEWRHSREQGGYGAVSDLGSHLVDFAFFTLGDGVTVTEATGSGRIFVPRRPDPQTGQMREVTAWDAAGFTLKFSNGALGTFEVSRFAAGSNTFEVDGSRRSVRLDRSAGKPGSGGKLSVYTFEAHHHQRPQSNFRPLRPTGFRAVSEFETFVKAIQGRLPARPNFHDGAHTLRVLDAVDQAIREGRTIKLP